MTNDIFSPEDFFGFKIGTDKNLARWDTIVDYFWHLDEASPCVEVRNLGKSTMGNPLILAVISAPENLKKLDRYKEISLRLAHPKDLSEDKLEEFIANGKAIISNTNSIHASEVGGTQMSSELAYELATRDDPEAQHIRENTIFLLLPSANPDGNKMIVDWYEEWLGTDYEGVGLPYLYHKYVGHDNNRDCYHLTQEETKILTRFLYKEWYPQAQIDHHHMGSFGARFNIPPHTDPIYEYIDPLIWAEQDLYGSMMLLDLETAGKTGVETKCSYHDVSATYAESPWLHGICGMLTESASAKLATPQYIHKHQLKSSSTLDRPEYMPQIVFPHPWEGEWWHLRDIVEQQKIATLATLKVAANNRKKILRNMYRKAKRQIERGQSQPPFAFIFTPEQHDPLTTRKFLQKLKATDVSIHQAREPFKVNGVTYPEGTYAVFTDQICRPYILKLLKRTFYHDGPVTRKADDTPISPYDLATDTLAEFMGVSVEKVSEPLTKKKFEKCEHISFPEGRVEPSENGYLLDPCLNETFKVVNKLLKNKIDVYRVHEPVKQFPQGSFYVPSQTEAADFLSTLAEQHHVTFHSIAEIDFNKTPIDSVKIGLYRRYWGGNSDEGWTRWLFEQYGFDYERLKDEEIEAGKLAEKYDVIMIPNDPPCMIRGEDIEEYYQERRPKFVMPKYPPEYRSGINEEAVKNLKTFVKNGGTLITFGQASMFAIEEFDLPINNPLDEIDSTKEFFCPGSTLKAHIDTTHPLAYGVNNEAYILYGHPWRDYPVFDLRHAENNENFEIIVEFPGQRILQSGWLIGEKHLKNKAALINAEVKKGNIIVSCFQPQFRAQTEATFKFLFNALFK